MKLFNILLSLRLLFAGFALITGDELAQRCSGDYNPCGFAMAKTEELVILFNMKMPLVLATRWRW